MTSRNQYVFQFTDQGSIAALEQRLAKLKKQLDDLAKSGEAGPGVARLSQQLSGSLRASEGWITRRQNELQKLLDLQQRVNQAMPNASGRAGLSPAAFPDAAAQGIGTKAELEAAIAQKQVQLDQQRVAANEALIASKDALLAREEQDQRLLEVNNSLEWQRQQLIKQIAAIGPGGEQLALAIAQRKLNLKKREAELQEQLAIAQERLVQGTPENVGRMALEQTLQSSKKIRDLEANRLQIAKDIAAVEKRAEDQGLARLSAQGGGTAKEQAAINERVAQTEAELTRLRNESADVERSISHEKTLQSRELERIRALETRGGAAAGSAELLQRIQQISVALARLGTAPVQELNRIFGGDLKANVESVLMRLEEMRKVDLTDPEEAAKFRELQDEAEKLLGTVEQFKTQDIPILPSQGDLLQQLPTFERTLIGAFRGIGRRFQATLQFAFSGALIFAAQRLVREFFDAALEVERSFADIQTALEFDIEAPKGTLAFAREVEKVRDRVLGIADDFNVLPQEVNKAAFQMISRFQDIDAAMIATRAQILATRVATIDQAEALRALTAVAEAYGQVLTSIEDDTTRQRLQAQLYADVLDKATVIQQEFGVAVEDTLEGAAGAAELYASLGLSESQLLADVGAIVRRSGQSGQAVFDRLQRFISAVSDPSVQDEILKLAGATDLLTLSLADFATDPAIGLEKVREAFPAILAENRQLANEIANTLGQRREATFARNYLLTGELSTDIVDTIADSAGRAEARVSVLLNTMQGSIEGVVAGFSTLAQRIQELGLLSPLGLLLKGVEATLGVVNSLVSAFNRLIGVLNVFRLPGPLGGLGDVLKVLLATTLAASSLRRVFQGLTFVTATEGLGKFVGLLKGTADAARATAVVEIGTAGTFGLAGVQRSLLGASAAGTTFGKTLKNFFINPLGTVKTAMLGAYAAMTRFLASVGVGTVVTEAATTSEGLLSRARILTTLANIRAAGVLGATRAVFAGLFNVLKGVVRFAAPIALIAGAAASVTGVLGSLYRFIQSILGVDVERGVSASDIQDSVDQALAEAEAAGIPLTEREARVKALSDNLAAVQQQGIVEITSVGDLVGGLFLALQDFGGGLTAGLLPGFKEEQSFVPQGNRLKSGFRNLDAARALLIDLVQAEQEQLAQYASISQAYGGEGAESIAAADLAIQGLFDIIDSSNPEDIRKGFNPNQRAREYEAAYATVLNAIEEILPGIDGFFEDVATAITGWAEIGTPQDVLDELARISRQQQLGRISPKEAQRLIREQIERAQFQIEQAKGNAAREQEAQDALEEAMIAEITVFEQRRAAVFERLSLIDDQDSRLLAEIQFLEQQLKEATDLQFGSEKIKQIQFEIYKRERELAKNQEAEARQRLEYNVESAKTFEDKIAALRALRIAVIEEIRAREGTQWYLDPDAITVEEERILNDLIEQEATLRRERAINIAKLNVLEKASTQDNIAAIVANIHAIRTEIEFLRREGADEIDIRLKLQELRSQEAALALAQAARRAAFYRLTAGTGDQIKAAQAELRAAQDQLATLTSLGAQDTQAYYEAQLKLLQAQKNLADLALTQADLQRRLASDLTDPLEQAALDVQSAQQALAAATGTLEKLQAQRELTEAENRHRQEFYDKQLSDLDFLYRTDQIGKSSYIAALRKVQAGLDRTKADGEALWREIELQILGLIDATEQAFNIPVDIRLPTLFEVRSAVQAEALAVTYQDNRTQDFYMFISEKIDLEEAMEVVGQAVDVDAGRFAPGGASITLGGF